MKLTFSLAMGFWSTLLLKESTVDKKSLASEDVVFIMVQNWDTFAFSEVWSLISAVVSHHRKNSHRSPFINWAFYKLINKEVCN